MVNKGNHPKMALIQVSELCLIYPDPSIYLSIYLSGKRMRRSTSKAVLLLYALDFLWVCWPILWVEFLVSTLLELWKHIDNLKIFEAFQKTRYVAQIWSPMVTPQKKSTVNSYAIFLGVTSISVRFWKYLPQKRTGWRFGQRKIWLRFICLTSIY